MGITTGRNLDFDDVLEHYGVKGMKWGVRRTPEQLGRARAARKARKAEAKKQKAADRSRPASEDAVKAATSRRVAKNAGTSALSNEELQALVNRMNLETKYAKLVGDTDLSIGAQFAKGFFDKELDAWKSGKDGPTANAVKVAKDVDKALNRALEKKKSN